MANIANIKDVAKRAGVSISTVSRVMNDSKNVSLELRVKVERAIEDLDFSANTIARSLKGSKTKTIAVVLTSLSRTFFTYVLEGINKEAAACGYSVLIAETHDSLEKEQKLVASFASQWVDGIIIASSASGDDVKTKKYVNWLGKLDKKGKRIPVVTLEFALDNPDIDAIVVDHEKAAYEAVKYLIDEIGKRRILFICIPFEHLIGQMRLNGYKRALQDHGITVDPELIVEGDYTSYFGYKYVMKKLQQKNRDFDAIFCANDQMAVGALEACVEKGIKVPDEISVMGNDDIFAASIVSPSLTSIHVPKYELGAIAMKRMCELLESSNGSLKGKKIVLETQIVERESTKAGSKINMKHLQW